MPFRLIAPVVQDFILERTDAAANNTGDATKVTIKQASQYDNERRSRILAKYTRIFNDTPGEIRITSQWTIEELRRMEARLTLAGCNIEGIDGNPLFRFKVTAGVPEIDMLEPDFDIAWGKLPPDVAQEIYEKVTEVNTSWLNPFLP